MKHLDFTHGRLAFSLDSFEMTPILPETLERRMQLFYVDDETGLQEMIGFSDFTDLQEMRKRSSAIWLHVSGTLGDEFWKHLRQFLDLSDEEVKQLKNPHGRPTYEDFPNGIFWTMHRASVTESVDAIEAINFFLCENVLITRQFSHDQAFAMLTHRLMSKGEQLANLKADSLAAELVGDVIDSFVRVLELGGNKLEMIQNRIIRNPGKKELYMINRAQQIIWIFLNTVWPIETVLRALSKSRNKALSDNGRAELAYRCEEAESVVRLFETYRATSYNLMDVYVSGIGLKTNETTTVLTIIATLFLPPTLIAGIYGMNFQIPEVHVEFGYYFCLGAMFAVSGGLLIWLKIRGFIDFS